MKKLIVANWKMNPDSAAEAASCAEGIEEAVREANDVDVVIAPPFPFLGVVKAVITTAHLGAQDCYFESKGAYTGEVSVAELADSGVSYVIVGHSERRTLGETDEMIMKKVRAVLETNMRAILCVGESADVRAKGMEAVQTFVAAQVRAALGAGLSVSLAERIVVAYEPIWAIGTGTPDTPEQSAAMARCIKEIIQAPVLYGGSVNAANARTFLKQKEIDGALVGSASLDPKEFARVIAAARASNNNE